VNAAPTWTAIVTTKTATKKGIRHRVQRRSDVTNKPTLITAWCGRSSIQRFGKYVSRSCICSLRLLVFTQTYDVRSRELKAAKAGHQRSHRQGDSLIKWNVCHFQAPIHTFNGIQVSLGLKLDNCRYSRNTAVFCRVKNKWNFHMSRLESIMRSMRVQKGSVYLR
jgi:hypothetical protein